MGRQHAGVARWSHAGVIGDEKPRFDPLDTDSSVRRSGAGAGGPDERAHPGLTSTFLRVRARSLRVVAHNPERASYFPAIEAKYGQPMAYWFERMAERADQKYPEQIAYLREEHGFSQAHANAVVMYCRGSTSAQRVKSLDDYLDGADPMIRTTLRAIIEAVTTQHPDLELVIAWNHPQLKAGDRYVLGLSAASKHILVAPWSKAVLDAFAPRLTDYKVNKKTFQVPADWSPDANLLDDLVAACKAEGSGE